MQDFPLLPELDPNFCLDIPSEFFSTCQLPESTPEFLFTRPQPEFPYGNDEVLRGLWDACAADLAVKFENISIDDLFELVNEMFIESLKLANDFPHADRSPVFFPSTLYSAEQGHLALLRVKKASDYCNDLARQNLCGDLDVTHEKIAPRYDYRYRYCFYAILIHVPGQASMSEALVLVVSGPESGKVLRLSAWTYRCEKHAMQCCRKERNSNGSLHFTNTTQVLTASGWQVMTEYYKNNLAPSSSSHTECHSVAYYSQDYFKYDELWQWVKDLPTSGGVFSFQMLTELTVPEVKNGYLCNCDCNPNCWYENHRSYKVSSTVDKSADTSSLRLCGGKAEVIVDFGIPHPLCAAGNPAYCSIKGLEKQKHIVAANPCLSRPDAQFYRIRQVDQGKRKSHSSSSKKARKSNSKKL